MRIIHNTIVTLLGISLAGCHGGSEQEQYAAAINGHYDFTSIYKACIPHRSEDMSQAEQEHDCAYQHYKDRKEEMDELYQGVLKLAQEKAAHEPSPFHNGMVEKLKDSQDNFRKFLKHNARMINTAYTNNYPYNYYGSMTDYINIRMRHLNNLKSHIQ